MPAILSFYQLRIEFPSSPLFRRYYALNCFVGLSFHLCFIFVLLSHGLNFVGEFIGEMAASQTNRTVHSKLGTSILSLPSPLRLHVAVYLVGRLATQSPVSQADMDAAAPLLVPSSDDTVASTSAVTIASIYPYTNFPAEIHARWPSLPHISMIRTLLLARRVCREWRHFFDIDTIARHAALTIWPFAKLPVSSNQYDAKAREAKKTKKKQPLDNHLNREPINVPPIFWKVPRTWPQLYVGRLRRRGPNYGENSRIVVADRRPSMTFCLQLF
jgi:hypothetical protein